MKVDMILIKRRHPLMYCKVEPLRRVNRSFVDFINAENLLLLSPLWARFFEVESWDFLVEIDREWVFSGQIAHIEQILSRRSDVACEEEDLEPELFHLRFLACFHQLNEKCSALCQQIVNWVGIEFVRIEVAWVCLQEGTIDAFESFYQDEGCCSLELREHAEGEPKTCFERYCGGLIRWHLFELFFHFLEEVLGLSPALLLQN
jgi:hypothetical protein